MMDTVTIVGLIGSIASIVSFFLGFYVCKKKYKINTQSNWFLTLFNFGDNNQSNESKQ